MPVASIKPLEALADHIRQKRGEDVSLADVVRLAEISTESFQAFFEAMNSSVLREMRDIADYITAMKHEIGSLQANDIRTARIPAAGQELDAIVKATEAATNSIMSCAESVMEIEMMEGAAYKARVDQNMLVIFEACSFQDITGQRIAKVVETLQHIEARVSRFAAAIRAQDIAGPLTELEKERAERKARLLMHGPPLEGAGNGQPEVDSLLCGKPRNSQSDIDELFA